MAGSEDRDHRLAMPGDHERLDAADIASPRELRLPVEATQADAASARLPVSVAGPPAPYSRDRRQPRATGRELVKVAFFFNDKVCRSSR
jgi:hypothetical protein